MPEASFYRVSCVDPKTGKQRHKQFSLKKYTKEQAEKLATEWKKSIRGTAADVDSSDSEAENTIMPPPAQPVAIDIPHNLDEHMKQFPIEEFDFERDPDKAMNACSFAIIGSSKSGKTTFLKHLLKEHFKDDIKLYMTQSPQADIYNSIRKSTVFVPDYIPEMIKECYKINKGTNNHYPFCVIVDDVVGAKNDKQMTKGLCLYRNSRLSICCVGQDFSMLNATGRANVNNICLFYTNTDNRIEDNIKLFLRSYLPRSLSLEEKIVLYRKLTENHCFLWIDCLNNTIKRCRLSEEDL